VPGRFRLWDAPVRIFHWAFATLVLFSWVTGQLAGPWLPWHMRSGYAILALLAFRLAWGVLGSESARFARFLQPPAAVWRYVGAVRSRAVPRFAGHNPLGGWMVVLMLGLVGLQAFSGLFVDDEISTQGPLSAKASTAFVARMNQVHAWNEWAIAAFVALHVVAIGVYRARFGIDLTSAMLDGRTDHADAGRLRFAPAWLAVLAFALACGFVYWLVTVYPAMP
jgi:cytochrome b